MADGSKELLVFLASALVADPGAVRVDEVPEEDGAVVLELTVGPEDFGRVIGRGGRTAQALRTVVKAAATRENRKVLVDIVD